MWSNGLKHSLEAGTQNNNCEPVSINNRAYSRSILFLCVKLLTSKVHPHVDHGLSARTSHIHSSAHDSKLRWIIIANIMLFAANKWHTLHHGFALNYIKLEFGLLFSSTPARTVSMSRVPNKIFNVCVCVLCMRFSLCCAKFKGL